MSEQMPQNSHELNTVEHDKIATLLIELRFKYGNDNSDICYVFEEGEYALPPNYEAVTVGVEEDVLTLEIVRAPDYDDKQTDTYVYCSEDRSLTLETTTEHHLEFVAGLKMHYNELVDERIQLIESAKGAYGSLAEELQAMEEWSGALEEYVRISIDIAAMLKAAENEELVHDLSMRDARNDASIHDLISQAALTDSDVAKLLEDYRRPLLEIQKLETELDILMDRIDANTETSPTQVGKADTLIALLDMVYKLEKAEQ